MSIFGSINNFAKMYNQNCGFGEDQKVLTYAILPKLHGTNGSILITPDQKVTARSKNRILAIGSDNHGFAQFVETKKEGIAFHFHAHLNDVILWGEWCGQGIHRGAHDMVCTLPEKTFFIFAIQIGDEMHTDLTPWALNIEEAGLHMVTVIEEVNIPFNHTIAIETVVQKVNGYVHEMETEDFFIKSLYPELEGCGEGIVGVLHPKSLSSDYFKYAFKAKTEAHRVKTAKLPATVREALPQDAHDFSATFVTKARVMQAMDELELPTDMTSTKPILSWVAKDIIKEGLEEMTEMGLEWKQLAPLVNSSIVRIWKDIVNENDPLK